MKMRFFHLSASVAVNVNGFVRIFTQPKGQKLNLLSWFCERID